MGGDTTAAVLLCQLQGGASSYKLSPPIMTEMKGLSGLRMLFTWARTEGRSLIQCKLMLLKTASNVFAW